MKKVGIPYPLLLAGYPVAALFAENQAILSFGDLVRPLLVSVACAALLWALMSFVLRDSGRGAAAATVLVLGFFLFDRVDKSVSSSGMSIMSLPVWGGATLVATALAAWLWRWHRIVGVFSLILFLLPILKVAAFQFSLLGTQVVQAAVGSRGAISRPDVIYVILDGYGRTDTFERLYGFSDREFVNGLKERGFFVAGDAHSNYCQTELSISSSLNLDYIQNLTNIHAVAASVRPSFRDALESSAAKRMFEKLGYRFSSIGTGFPPLSFYQTEIDQSAPGLNLLESALIQKTPLSLNSQIWTSQFEARHRQVMSALDRLGSLGGTKEVPRFTFVHILAPHPPFSFGPNGETLRPKGPFGYWDGSDYMAVGGSPESYRQGYSGQAEFIGKQVLKAVDRILHAPGPKPIIIIQGDHGPKMHLDQHFLKDTDVDECFPILNAYLVPETMGKALYQGITPVNTFRTLFRVLFREDYPNLPDRSWYSPFDDPLRFSEVTARLK